jgi:hypothetical protein
MKMSSKATIAACSLGLAASMGAQAEGVSFYALVDGGVANSTISGRNAPSPNGKTEFVTGGYAPTFAGMKYEKPVEGGYTVGVQLEQGFLLTPDNAGNRWGFGNGNILNRQGNIYVSNELGKLVVGTQPNIAFNQVLVGDARSGSNYGSSLAMIDIAGSLNTVDDASISYTSPTFSGFTFAGQYVTPSKAAIPGTASTNPANAPANPGVTPSGSGINHGSRATVSYSSGALTGGLAWYTSTLPGVVQTNNGTIAAVSYKLEPFTLKGLYASQKTATYASSALNTWGLGGAYALGSKTTFDAGYFRSTSGVGGLSTNTYAAGVQYKLTSSLAVYGQYAYVQNKSTTQAAPYNFTWTTEFTDSLAAGQNATTVNVGLLFSFF